MSALNEDIRSALRKEAEQAVVAYLRTQSSNVEPLVVSPLQAKFMLGCGTTRLYEMLNCGDLESYMDGASRRITVASIRAYIERQLAASQPPRAA